jgi:Na+/proline symporter
MGWNELVSGFIIFGILTMYMVFSGEVGGIMTQTFQGLVMVIAGFVIIGSFFFVTGGFGAIVESVSSAGPVTAGGITKEFSPNMMNAWGTSAPGLIFAWIFIPIVGTVGQPQSIARMYALKDPTDVPKSAFYNCLSHVVVATVSIIVGFAVMHLVATGKVAPLARADQAIFVFADYCGIVTQLFVYAAVLAAAMSSASMYLSVASTAVSRDIPASLGLRMQPATQLLFSRVIMFIIGVVAIFFSVSNPQGVAIIGTFGWGTLMTATFPTFIIGLLWRKASRRGVSAALAVALVLNLLSLTGLKWPGTLPWYVNVIAITLLVTVGGSYLWPDTKKLDEKMELAMDL